MAAFIVALAVRTQEPCCVGARAAGVVLLVSHALAIVMASCTNDAMKLRDGMAYMPCWCCCLVEQHRAVLAHSCAYTAVCGGAAVQLGCERAWINQADLRRVDVHTHCK